MDGCKFYAGESVWTGGGRISIIMLYDFHQNNVRYNFKMYNSHVLSLKRNKIL